MIKEIANNVTFIGIEDTTLDLFEGLYKVPNGVTYNSVVFKSGCLLETYLNFGERKQYLDICIFQKIPK